MYRVMLADDEPLILAGIASMLCWEDHQCKIVGKAANGVQALEKMQELKPDIVITDIRMPAMDGITLVRRAKEQGLGAVFILLTNLEEFSLARDAVSLGVVDYLVKLELSEETLADALKRAVMRCEENRKQGQAQEERTEDTQEERIRGYFRGLLFRMRIRMAKARLQRRCGSSLQSRLSC